MRKSNKWGIGRMRVRVEEEKHGVSHWTKRRKLPLPSDKVKETLVTELSLLTE
jgi:hypothetical protein